MDACGRSGKVPSAIHMCPECLDGGPLAKVLDGDIIILNTQTGEVNVQVDEKEFAARIAPANRANLINTVWGGSYSVCSAIMLPRQKTAHVIYLMINPIRSSK